MVLRIPGAARLSAAGAPPGSGRVVWLGESRPATHRLYLGPLSFHGAPASQLFRCRTPDRPFPPGRLCRSITRAAGLDEFPVRHRIWQLRVGRQRALSASRGRAPHAAGSRLRVSGGAHGAARDRRRGARGPHARLPPDLRLHGGAQPAAARAAAGCGHRTRAPARPHAGGRRGGAGGLGVPIAAIDRGRRADQPQPLGAGLEVGFLRRRAGAAVVIHGRAPGPRPPSGATVLAAAGVAVWAWRKFRGETDPAGAFAAAGAAFWILLYFGRPFWGPALLVLGAAGDMHLHRVIGGAQVFLVLLADHAMQ